MSFVALKTLTKELVWSLRRCAHTPGSTVAAVVVLALGIGSTVTVYTVGRAVVLDELALRQPNELVVVERTIAGEATSKHAPVDLLDLREHRELFSELSASAGFRALMTGAREPTYVQAMSVTPEYFETLGAVPFLGETFRSAGDRTDVVVLSWRLWQEQLGADQDVVTKAVLLNGQLYQVAGVMPKDVAFLGADLWVPGPQGLPRSPVPAGPDLKVRRDLAYVNIVGRLRAGLNPTAAQAVMDVVGRRIAQKYPADHPSVRFFIRGYKELVVGDARDHLTVLSTGVGLVFILACLSVAGLLVGRGIGRSHEDGVRLALGANRAQLLTGALADGLVLATAGGILGTLASTQGVRLLLTIAPPMQRAEETVLDVGVLIFAAGVCIVATLLASALPTLRLLRAAPRRTLVSGSRPGQTRERHLAWTGLLVFQVALMVLLMVGSVTLSRRLIQLRAVDLGFNSRGLLVGSVVLPRQRYGQPAAAALFFDQLLGRLDARREIDAAGVALDVPLGTGKVGESFSIVGGAGEAGAPAPTAWFSVVSSRYFETVGMQIVEGRGVTVEDRAGSSPVAVVNRAMAKRYWPNGNSVGAQLRFAHGELVRIVGVVSDVRHDLFEPEAEPRVYRPYLQSPWPAMSLVVRSRGDLTRLIPVIRSAVRDIDPGQPLPTFSFMEERLADAMRPTRYLFLLIGVFGIVAASITAVGLYGLLMSRAYQEERELAIRLALGAPRALLVVRRLVRGLSIAIAGVALGMAGSLAAWPVLQRVVPAMEGSPGAGLSIVALLSLLIATLSSLVPALHVLRVDPSQIGRRL